MRLEMTAKTYLFARFQGQWTLPQKSHMDADEDDELTKQQPTVLLTMVNGEWIDGLDEKQK
jgi:hypothetical protein